MPFTMLGTELGMTRVFQKDGRSFPVTVIHCGPCVVTQIRTVEIDGYSAIQLGFGERKARNSTQPLIAHDMKAGCDPKRYHREFRCTPAEAANYTLGQVLTVKDLENIMFVDVIGRSKGKGFQGVMKRHHFKGMFASHGTERKHRSPGSIGAHCSNRGFGGGLKKGKRMPGRMGNERVTVRNLDIVRIEPEQNILLVKGPVPGANRGLVQIRTSLRLWKPKAIRLAAGKK